MGKVVFKSGGTFMGIKGLSKVYAYNFPLLEKLEKVNELGGENEIDMVELIRGVWEAGYVSGNMDACKQMRNSVGAIEELRE